VKEEKQMELNESKVEEQAINLLDLLIVFLKRKRLIIGGTSALAVITAIVCLVLSPIYEATAKIMPPQQSSTSMAAQVLGQLGGAASMLLGGSTPQASGYLYVGLMQSQAILDPIVARFDLLKLYNVETTQLARKVLLDDKFKAEVDSGSGIISVSIQDLSPERAANMVNTFTVELKKLLENLAVTESGKRRVFFEGQLKKSYENLSQAEESLKVFQQASGVLKIDDQAVAILQGIAALKAQLAAKEVQLKVMKTYATANNPDLKKVDEELTALKEELGKLEEKQEGHAPDVIIPTSQIPTLGLEYIRKMRDFKYQETLYELLVKQYEAARLDEAREAAIVQLIHQATPPENRLKPKVPLMVILATVIGIFLFSFTAFLMEFIEKASGDPENEERFKNLKKFLK
jgi:tyrosine-protein kinase Etk/Wzc